MPDIVTFYSYKGGVGRTMALVNVAHALAGLGYRVLTIDLDLEAPGMTQFFAEAIRGRPQRSDRDSLALLTRIREALIEPNGFEALRPIIREFDRYVVPIPLSSDRATQQPSSPISSRWHEGCLHFMPATLTPRNSPEGHDEDYLQRLDRLALGTFFADHEQAHRMGSALRLCVSAARFEAPGDLLYTLSDPVQACYDFVLIDSRTGLNEFAGLSIGPACDAVVVCCALNEQNISGTGYFLQRAGFFQEGTKPFVVAIGPVPPWLRHDTERRIEHLQHSLRALNIVEIPYHPRAAIEETVFVNEHPREPIAQAYQQLAAMVIEMCVEPLGFVAARQRSRFEQTKDDINVRQDWIAANLYRAHSESINRNRGWLLAWEPELQMKIASGSGLRLSWATALHTAAFPRAHTVAGRRCIVLPHRSEELAYDYAAYRIATGMAVYQSTRRGHTYDIGQIVAWAHAFDAETTGVRSSNSPVAPMLWTGIYEAVACVTGQWPDIAEVNSYIDRIASGGTKIEQLGYPWPWWDSSSAPFSLLCAMHYERFRHPTLSASINILAAGIEQVVRRGLMLPGLPNYELVSEAIRLSISPIYSNVSVAGIDFVNSQVEQNVPLFVEYVRACLQTWDVVAREVIARVLIAHPLGTMAALGESKYEPICRELIRVFREHFGYAWRVLTEKATLDALVQFPAVAADMAEEDRIAEEIERGFETGRYAL